MSFRPLRSERPRGAQRKPVTSTQKQIVFVTPATQPLLITKALSLTQHLLLKLAGMSEWANSNKSCQRSKKEKRKEKVVWRPTALISKRDHYLIRKFTTSWFPFSISHALWNDLSVPTLFVASIVPILLVLDSCNGLTAERHEHSLLPRHFTALILPSWLVVTCLKWPPTAALTSTLPWLCDTSDCTCQPLSSKPYPLNAPPLTFVSVFFPSSDFSSLFSDQLLFLLLCPYMTLSYVV